MKAQLLSTIICLCGITLLSEGASTAKDKKPVVPMKTKTGVLTPTPAPIPSKTPKKLTPLPKHAQDEHKRSMALVKESSGKWKTDDGQKAALNKLFANEPINDQERQRLSDLLFNAQQSGLSK